MAADVERMGGGGGGGDPKAAATKDLLASSFFNSQELDLDLHVPFGWEKRLDLKSGRVYLQRCSSSSDSSNPCLDHKQTLPKLQDLNFPPSSHMPMFQDSTSLDLKLASSTQSPPTVYQSVCTLDKVKSALQRAEKEPPPVSKKRSQFRGAAWWWNSSPPSHSSSSSEVDDDDDARPVAAGCPGCLSYVLVVTSSPQCPRCGTLVPLPPFKKPCIDLNISI